MKIVKLDIDENSILAGIDAVALVEQPAIEEDFYYFSKHNGEEFAETYTDYPKGAIEAAKMGIKRNEEIGNKCATQVGKVRAQQLANREPISLDTVRRMRAFLIRQKGNYDLAIERKDYNACGYISYLLWGGPEALPWAEKIIRRVEGGEEMAEVFTEATILETIIKHELFAKLYDTKEEAIIAAELLGCSGAHEMDGKWMPCSTHEEMEVEVSTLPSYDNEVSGSVIEKTSFAALDEKQMLVGPLMTPNKLIKRLDENNEEYYVYFTEDTIRKISYKMMKDKLIDRVNIEHNSADMVDDAYMVESWLVDDPATDKATKYGFAPTKGQWFGIYKIDNKKIWDDYVKSGKVKGFSIEGFFENYAMSKTKCRKNGECSCGRTQHTGGLCDGSHLK